MDLPQGTALLRRMAWRLVPLLTVTCQIASIDRANVGYAKLTVLPSLHMSEVASGFVGQDLMPWVRRTTGSVAASMVVPAACLLVPGIGALIAWRASRTETAAPAAGQSAA